MTRLMNSRREWRLPSRPAPALCPCMLTPEARMGHSLRVPLFTDKGIHSRPGGSMAEAHWTLQINGRSAAVQAAPDTPLLYVLQNDLALKGARFGCGLAQCGACSVLLDGREVRGCVTPVSAIGARAITTLEGLPQWHATQQGLRRAPDLHPVQQALIDE